jgi:hypothetical protein
MAAFAAMKPAFGVGRLNERQEQKFFWFFFQKRTACLAYGF